VDDTDPADGSYRLSFDWGDPHVNVIGHTRVEVPAVSGGFRCDLMYRHLTHTQVLMPLDSRCVLAVATPQQTFHEISTAETVTAFLLDPLQAVVLHKGTWHWGPFPTVAAEVRLFNIQGLRYVEDNEMVDLASRGMAVEVLTG